ncbi:GTP diphosphokinase [Plesiomonas shigelloides]|uniref:GTP diphosphokinase n=1 Tax=Plesiomonas shigelloides TaxID=703 RepID=UPI000A0FA9F4|nr:GTP diphosphokinase [Plesiomonas shigelloides]HAD43441.1 GTP diphosphokinase [Plesiomonas shigelloides]
MVAVRGAHLNKDGVFALEKWINSLGLSPEAGTRVSETWRYCEAQIADPEHAGVLLSRGLEMVEILATLSMDIDSLRAALIFPLVSDGVLTPERVEEECGKSIMNLISGVMEMDAIRQLNATQNGSTSSEQVDNVRRMLLAMVEDFRCVVIKLAERIAHLREVKDADEEQRVLVAKECTNIYAPLANRLGIGQLKWELEDYCFRYLHPAEYKRIAKLLHERRIDREQYIDTFVDTLRSYIKESGVQAEVYGRPKHIYSIWRKMQKKMLEFDELFDVRAIRIITERLQDCYAALGVVHTHFKHLPSEFDDYVANPKPNGYQSIHTVVLGPQGKTIEIQIRTRQMHEDAELGVAAHWKYKEGGGNVRSGYEERIAWLRKLLAWQEEISDSGEMLDELRSQVFDDRVYVFTPKGDVVDLPAGSTPLDFAYHIHSDVGHRCIGAKIGGRIVPFTYKLQMGDQIEIITQKNPNPSRDWLNPNLGFVNSSRGRAKIHAYFKKLDRDKNIAAGKEMLEGELSRMGLGVKDVEKLVLERFNVKTMEEVLAGIGGGDLRLNQLVNFLQNRLMKPDAETADKEALRTIAAKAQHAAANKATEHKPGRIVVEGVGNLMHYIARCCQPIPGDEIVGFITQGRGISIHRADCEQLHELLNHAPERVVEAVWGECYSSGYTLSLRVLANDRSGLLRDITTILANEKVNVLGVASRSDTKKQLATIDMEVELYNLQALGRILTRIGQLSDVIEARRLRG